MLRVLSTAIVQGRIEVGQDVVVIRQKLYLTLRDPGPWVRISCSRGFKSPNTKKNPTVYLLKNK